MATVKRYYDYHSCLCSRYLDYRLFCLKNDVFDSLCSLCVLALPMHECHAQLSRHSETACTNCPTDFWYHSMKAGNEHPTVRAKVRCVPLRCLKPSQSSPLTHRPFQVNHNVHPHHQSAPWPTLLAACITRHLGCRHWHRRSKYRAARG